MAAKTGDGPAHRQVGGVVDVQAVDVGHRRRTNAHRQRPATHHGRQTLALDRGHRLGVADAGDALAVGRHDHRGCHNSSTGRRDAHLIHPGNSQHAVTPQRALKAEGGDDHGHREKRSARPAGVSRAHGECGVSSGRRTGPARLARLARLCDAPPDGDLMIWGSRVRRSWRSEPHMAKRGSTVANR